MQEPKMMRTTLRLDDQLFREVKTVAAESGRTITAIVEDALRESLARRRQSASRRRISLPTFDGGGLMPGVAIDNSAALLDIMEAHDAPL
jgi:hypothetical protein